MTSGTGKVTRVALETPGDKAKMLPPACLPGAVWNFGELPG